MSKAISKKARATWHRLASWYGTRLAEQFGAEPPPDWALLIDASDEYTLNRALMQLRLKHTAHPPTFPEFEKLVFAAAPTLAGSEQSVSTATLLHDHALARVGKQLSAAQLRGPWIYLGPTDAGGKAVGITGVVIDPDPPLPGYRFMLEDLQAP